MTGRLQFSSYHIVADPEQHVAAYGARLLWDEVMAGSSGVVYDRQDVWGDPEVIRTLLHPAVDKVIELARLAKKGYLLSAADKEKDVRYDDGRVHAVAAPQGSFGYLYVTAVLDREGA